MASVSERIECVRPSMERLLWEYRHGKNPPIFTLRGQAVDLSRSMNLLRKLHISSKYVVVHPRNRYGDGIVVGHVSYFVNSFSIRGFSQLEIGSPFASEVPPATNPRSVDVKAFNEAMVKDAQGALPPIAEEEYLIMSVAKSHSSMASRCVIFAMPLDNAMITDGGKLNLQKITAMRPE